MKIRDVLDYVMELKEPAFSEKTLLRWLNQIEAEIQAEILLIAEKDIVQYTMDDMETELIAPAPFDKIYEDYLIWRIHEAQEEAERANNAQAVYNKTYVAYSVFVCETINPGLGKAEKMRYYLSAYGIARKHGFAGTEEEWLKSLKGQQGQAGPQGAAGAGVTVEYDEESGTVRVRNVTGEDLQGEDGVGIEKIVPKTQLTSGNVYTVVLTNKETYDFTAPVGPQGLRGLPGEAGAGINVLYDEESGTVQVVNIGGGGGSGGSGEEGVGIAEIVFKEPITEGYLYAVVLTDGSSYDIVAPMGPQGAQGVQGPQGVQGAQGNNGLTPVKGIDYYTEADKSEMVSAVLNALPTWTGGSY